MTRSILLADDDPDICEMVTMILESQDCRVRVAHHGADCLELLAAERPDLLILDLLMPVMDGFTVCRELAAERFSHLREMPVLIFTSVPETVGRGRYLRDTGCAMQVTGFLGKPFTPSDLIRKVREILGN